MQRIYERKFAALNGGRPYKAAKHTSGNENVWKWAGSQALAMTLTNEYLASVGYDDILERYKALHLSY